MDGALLAVAIVAALAAILAAVFAGSSARSARRSADLAAEAVEVERDRHHRELAPRIQLEHDGPIGGLGEEEGVWFTSAGPLDYTSVAFTLTQEDADRPIAGFLIDGEALTAGDVGRSP